MLKPISSKHNKGYAIILIILILASIPLVIYGLYSTYIQNIKKDSNKEVNTTVDYSKIKQKIDEHSIGISISGLGWTNGKLLDFPRNTIEQTALNNLQVSQLKISLGYQSPGDKNSKIVCKQKGCDTSEDEKVWINAIAASGAKTQIEVQMDPNYQQFWHTDAANLVRHFNLNKKTKVKRWVIGKEPDLNNISAKIYAETFNKIYDAMKSIDPDIKVGGPSISSYNREYLDTFLEISGSRVDFINYHEYGENSKITQNSNSLLNETVRYENNINNLRSVLIEKLGEERGNKIEVEVGEWNISRNPNEMQLTHEGSIWSASVLGHILNSGAFSRTYTDKNGLLGILCQSDNPEHNNTRYSCKVDDPMPIYHGIGMFTGENLFPSFGSHLISSTTSLANVEIFASDNPKNIVTINKNSTESKLAVFNLINIPQKQGVVTVWQKGISDKFPQNKDTEKLINGTFSYYLDPYTITTFVITYPSKSK